jgi:hypothetical protein
VIRREGSTIALAMKVIGAQKAVCPVIGDEAGDGAIAVVIDRLTWEAGSPHCSYRQSFPMYPLYGSWFEGGLDIRLFMVSEFMILKIMRSTVACG